MCAAQEGHSVNATASAPDADSVFYRIDTSIRKMQDQFWGQTLKLLRRKKKKLAKVKCYITVDETYDSYTGNLHKKPVRELTREQKTIRQYIHEYQPKKGDTGSFKYLVFALVYGRKKMVLRAKALRRKEEYWSLVVRTLKELSSELKFECALMDRGFYVAELIDQLQKESIPFVVRACICDYMKIILGIYREWKIYEYDVAGWAKTKLILGRDFRGYPWGFVTNLSFNHLEDIRFLYKKRWNIENIFKATDGIQLKVATSNHITRMFAVCLSFLIYNAWQNKNMKPTLLDFIKKIFQVLFAFIRKISPYRDKFKLNLPLWDFLEK
ncbi:transposase [Candidatus Woesearchaeota archaeon]|nr:transposase [Candidatus Woesearchaeota archaeon]